MMRVDLHIHVGEETDFNNVNDLISTIKSILTSAIIKGLDVVGIVAHEGPSVGWRAMQQAKDNQIDLYVVPGQEYVCSDKLRIIAYYLKEPLPPNLASDKAIEYVHKNNGLVMALDLTTRQAQHLNSVVGTIQAPDMVEAYNAAVGGYHDIEVKYPEFISSAAKSAKDMENINVYSLVNRKVLEKMQIIPEGEGVDYTPKYLDRADKINQGADPSDVAEGDIAPSGENINNPNQQQQPGV